MDLIRCPRCRKALPSVANFCPQCGMSVREVKASPSPKPAKPVPPALSAPSRAPALALLLVIIGIVFLVVTWSSLRSSTRQIRMPARSLAMPSAGFMGIIWPAQRVAYVCTGRPSRSTTDTFLAEVRQSVGRLDHSQAFNVCFTAASDGTLEQGSLLQANAANKARAFRMSGRLGIAGAQPDVLGMQRVFSQRPDVIFLLADADLSPSNEEFIAACRMQRQGIRINTIAVRTRENQSDAGRRRFEDALRRIAVESGGQYRTLPGR